nr:RNA recognition domain-containing protein [Colletotrichum truncatum]KAF6788917.1 RNA recognition domain-containing protein [Colletotrichum truncatum]
MSSSAESKMLLEHLHKLSMQHEREQASQASSLASQKAGSVLDHQTTSVADRKSPGFSSISSEDPERGVSLDVSSLRGSPNSFPGRSEAVGKALRPTMSATAAVRAQDAPVQADEDIFNDAVVKGSRPIVVSSYSLNQSHIQQVEVKNDNVSPTKDRSYNKFVGAIDPQATWPSTACVFVANLPEHREDWTLEAAVTKEFERFGVVFVKIRRDNQGMPFAFVQFTNDASANEARVRGKGMMILGRPCRTETVRANRTYIIYRRNRSAITLEEANELLSPFGRLETARFLDNQIQEQMRLPVTIRVQFKDFDPSQQVLRAFRLNKVYKVEAYDFKKAMQARARHPDRKFLDHYDRDRRSIFMTDLPLDTTEQDIRGLMEDVGGVVSVQMKRMEYPHDGPKLIAFVEFTNASLPDMAIERYHNNMVGGFPIRVERRTDKRRREPFTPARVSCNVINDHDGMDMVGKGPSTPVREQRGTLSIEAGSANFSQDAVQVTPLRSEMCPPMAQNAMQHNIGHVHQNTQGMQMQMPMVAQQAVGPAFNQASHQTPVQVPHQGPMQFPMAPPPLPHPQQMGTPMMPPPNMGCSPFMPSPYSQGPGSAYGFMTPQQSPAPFWGYGNGTPLWTPFPIDPAAFMAYTSPVPPPRSNAGVGLGPVASAPVEASQVTQSEPVMVDKTLTDSNQGQNEEH